jgi:uncharacterized repeat protein (TIGR01451 family)
MILSMMVPAITLLSVSPALAQNPENIIVQGDADARQHSTNGTPPPWKIYEAGDNPPIMWAEDVGNGRVVAAGFARMTNGGENYPKLNWRVGELDVLFDVAFRWMIPDNTEPIKVLWYGSPGGTYAVYNDALKASFLIDNLEAKGYDIDNTDNAPITSSMLAPYDILVLPGLQLGDFYTGGDPDLLPDADVLAIDSFVREGGGLFIMESADWDGANFYKVQNKILEKLEFSMFFQSDTIVDPDSLDPTYVREGMGAVFEADVTNVLFGADYITATGKSRIRVYKVPSLAPPPEKYGVFTEISPRYLEGLPGGTLGYEVTVNNVGETKNNFFLSASVSLGWDAVLEETIMELENVYAEENKSRSTKLWITIPPGTSVGTEAVITVTATAEDNTLATHSAQSLVIVGSRVRPTIADAQVVEGKPTDKFGPKGWMYVGSSATAKFKNEETFLKFDLQAMGTASVDNVRLYLHNFALMGAPDKTVKLHRVDVSWWEDNITWNTKPAFGDLIDEVTLFDEDLWYSWDVTSYVQERRGIDNLASFALTYEIASESYPDNWSYGFSPKEHGENIEHPYLAVGRSVSMRAAPNYEEGLRGGTLSYKVLVQNTGALHDTYTLTASDNAAWSPTISPSSLTLAPGAFGIATVTVTIPPGAPIGDNIDNITITATSTDPTVSDSVWFVVDVSDKNIGPPDDDSTAKQAEPVGNWVWGADYTVGVGREALPVHPPENGPVRGFLKFDLSAIQPGTSIARARLWLNAEEVEDVGAVVRVHSVADDSWVERSTGAGRLMWDNQPSIGDVLDVRAVVSADRWYSWDVTGFVQNEFVGDKVASFALVDLGENIPPAVHTVQFTSKESDAIENHPYLEILTAEPTYGVRAYVSPIFQGGEFGTTLTYTVTVKNTGTTSDTYDLSVTDTEGWGPTVTPSTLSLGAGASGTATLEVTIPSVEVCTLDRITVTVTGTGVSDSAIAFAHVSAVDFKLENLYKVKLVQWVEVEPYVFEEFDPSLRLREDADNLVAKFYPLFPPGPEGESVVWDIMPWHLTSRVEVPHPLGSVVEKVDLVLIDEGVEIVTLASFTLTQDILWGRIMAIKSEWPLPGADHDALFDEIMGIKGMWPIVG